MEALVQVAREREDQAGPLGDAVRRLAQRLFQSDRGLPAFIQVSLVDLAAVMFVDVAPEEHPPNERDLVGVQPLQEVDPEPCLEVVSALQVVKQRLFQGASPADV